MAESNKRKSCNENLQGNAKKKKAEPICCHDAVSNALNGQSIDLKVCEWNIKGKFCYDVSQQLEGMFSLKSSWEGVQGVVTYGSYNPAQIIDFVMKLVHRKMNNVGQGRKLEKEIDQIFEVAETDERCEYDFMGLNEEQGKQVLMDGVAPILYFGFLINDSKSIIGIQICVAVTDKERTINGGIFSHSFYFEKATTKISKDSMKEAYNEAEKKRQEKRLDIPVLSSRDGLLNTAYEIAQEVKPRSILVVTSTNERVLDMFCDGRINNRSRRVRALLCFSRSEKEAFVLESKHFSDREKTLEKNLGRRNDPTKKTTTQDIIAYDYFPQQYPYGFPCQWIEEHISNGLLSVNNDDTIIFCTTCDYFQDYILPSVHRECNPLKQKFGAVLVDEDPIVELFPMHRLIGRRKRKKTDYHEFLSTVVKQYQKRNNRAKVFKVTRSVLKSIS